MSFATAGRIVSASSLEDAVEDTLRLWLPFYLGEVTEQNPPLEVVGDVRQVLLDPAGIVRTSAIDWPIETAPTTVMLASPGMAADTSPGLDGSVRASWTFTLAIFATMPERTDTRRAAQLYAAALSTTMTAKGLEVDGASVRFVREMYDGRPARDARTQVLAYAEFVVDIEDARPGMGTGPVVPPPGRDPAPVLTDGPEVEVVVTHDRVFDPRSVGLLGTLRAMPTEETQP